MNNNLGSTFKWFVGSVEDITDPFEIGRVRVRIYGHHSLDTTKVPTNSLPWCQIILPALSQFIDSVGILSVGLQVGSQVIGFFLDGPNEQHPIILGSFSGKQDAESLIQFSKNALTSRNSNRDSTSLFSQPLEGTPQYPNNSIEATKSGHLFETDDTPNNERILVEHKSGSYNEFLPDGSNIEKLIGNKWEIISKDNNTHIKGNANAVIDGSLTINIGANQKIVVSNNKISLVSQSTSVEIADGQVKVNGNLIVSTGATGTFLSKSGQVITVQNGIITNIE